MGVMDQSDLLKELRIDSRQREDAGGSSRWPWIAGAILLAVVLIGSAVWFYFGGQRFAVQAATAIAPSANGGDTAVLQATGYITARREATVSAQITGTLTEVLIEEGEHVDKDQVLAHLDDTAQKAALAQAQAQASATQATLLQYQAQLEQARRDLKRAQDLVGRHLVSQQALEDAQTQVATLGAQVAAQRKQIELAQAGVKAAQVQLDYCTVRAPFAGVIIAKNAQVGEIVSPFSAGGGFTRTGVGTIVDMDSLEVDVDVNEAYINRVQPNQQAQAVLDAYPNWTIPAHVIAVIPTADRSKATVKVRIALDQKDARVLPDMGARVSFLEEAKKNTSTLPLKGVLVPSSSIVQRDGKSLVFAIDGDHARARAVTPGQRYSDLRLVEGITAGTLVVKQPPTAMNDGAKVTIETAGK
ncbi:MAG: efflux RND transporter periplasmic adaptor subunit [Xanthomonadaceae bacterium]|nr:efflux RND transporter periplasmic adaptor subunit [Xanthomonadaceae bacterium]MDE1886258.1 efflux RND transporter periplasmic adaptor subunit [Xanthomonadaceae bacterium]MDE2084756.1 efflux RND transporter periplasmic adaptor subunit [Xanthomonadaceae bacterium]MDE2258106.1 efflux RND transporter periplasmic adaptor subunit [Xanthomonadaceae bacterium]